MFYTTRSEVPFLFSLDTKKLFSLFADFNWHQAPSILSIKENDDGSPDVCAAQTRILWPSNVLND